MSANLEPECLHELMSVTHRKSTEAGLYNEELLITLHMQVDWKGEITTLPPFATANAKAKRAPQCASI